MILSEIHSFMATNLDALSRHRERVARHSQGQQPANYGSVAADTTSGPATVTTQPVPSHGKEQLPPPPPPERPPPLQAHVHAESGSAVQHSVTEAKGGLQTARAGSFVVLVLHLLYLLNLYVPSFKFAQDTSLSSPDHFPVPWGVEPNTNDGRNVSKVAKSVILRCNFQVSWTSTLLCLGITGHLLLVCICLCARAGPASLKEPLSDLLHNNHLFRMMFRYAAMATQLCILLVCAQIFDLSVKPPALCPAEMQLIGSPQWMRYQAYGRWALSFVVVWIVVMVIAWRVGKFRAGLLCIPLFVMPGTPGLSAAPLSVGV